MTMIVAGLFGILVPVTLKKMNIDPAIASSVFVTTITDVIGFVSFLGVGAYFYKIKNYRLILFYLCKMQ